MHQKMLPYWRLHQQFFFFPHKLLLCQLHAVMWLHSEHNCTRPTQKGTVFSHEMYCLHLTPVSTMKVCLRKGCSTTFSANAVKYFTIMPKKILLRIHTVLYTVSQYSCFLGGVFFFFKKYFFVYKDIVGGYCRITVYVYVYTLWPYVTRGTFQFPALLWTI